jgi:hypothetical protein
MSKSSDEVSHTKHKFPAPASAPKPKVSNDTGESLTGASASAHKQQAIDVEKETGGNAGALKKSLPAPAPRASSPAAPKADIVEDPNIEFDKETTEIVASTLEGTSPAPATPVSYSEFDKDTIEIVASTLKETSPAPAAPVSYSEFDKDTIEIVASTPKETSPAPAAPVSSPPAPKTGIVEEPKME